MPPADLAPPNNRPRSRAGLPSWIASAVVHGLLLLLAVWLLSGAPRGGDEAPREAGIVLRTTSNEATLFEGQRPEPADSPSDSISEESQQALLDALPPADTAGLAELLPSKQETGPAPAAAAQAASLASGGAPRGGVLKPGQARVSVFGVEGEGSRFVYLFDRSISMAGAPLRAAQNELIRSLGPLESIHQFQIIFFNQSQSVFDLSGGQKRVAFATDPNKQLAADFVSGVTASGGTDRYEALTLALRMRPDALFFLTDADDPMTPREMKLVLGSRAAGAVTINTIEFGRGPSPRRRNFLVALAEATSGQYGYVDTQRLTK
ncbi:hypothetical protein Mal64_13250 [Pseudobythopirellula maris]|uniref:VWFA domain-containing protein n=1 Tax=Pseudobythopirellula maris TaxID=2527991 RepID=A0A5C5ZUP0_9BACT|nr:hypothetical protein [Pseudobythopirellula maris]TWT90926.1 hypothetical protein Mal64_13250 [Pseudobythopirellula maris]